MRKRFPILVLSLVAGLLLAACGGHGGSANVPSNDVAVVGNDSITRAQFAVLLNQAKKSYQSQKRAFPKPGTPEYEQVKQQAMQYLVQRAEFAQKAKDLGVEVTDKQVADRLAQVKKQYF